jgi:hypothetical protein
MIFDPTEISPGVIKVTPRICHGGELLAMWIVAYGKTPATHLWDIGVARAFSNVAEINMEIESEMQQSNCNRIQAQRNIILKSGLYKLKETPADSEVSISISKDVAEQLKVAADRSGLTLDEYLKRRLND